MSALLKHRWLRRLGVVIALIALERGLSALLVSAEGAQVLMAAGPGTPTWIGLAFAGMMAARLTLWLWMPGCVLGWCVQEGLRLRRR